MLCFILNGEALTDETKKEEITSNNSEITLKQYSDLLEMEYKDFQSLLDAAEIEVSDSSAVFTKDNQMKLVQFLQNFSNPDKKSGEIFEVESEEVEINEKQVYLIKCKRGKEPCYLIKKNKNKKISEFYTKLDSITEKLDGKDLIEYIQSQFK